MHIFTLFFDEQQVAERNNDPEMADFIESEFLTEQVNLNLMFLILYIHVIFTLIISMGRFILRSK